MRCVAVLGDFGLEIGRVGKKEKRVGVKVKRQKCHKGGGSGD